MVANGYVGVSLHSPPQNAFDQRARHRVCDPTEIALWKGVKARGLDTHLKPDPERHRPGRGEILLKAGEEVAERALAAAEERVDVPRLGCPGSMGHIGRQGVALEHDHLLEEIGERPRRRQAGHPGADHDRLAADQPDCHVASPRCGDRK